MDPTAPSISSSSSGPSPSPRLAAVAMLKSAASTREASSSSSSSSSSPASLFPSPSRPPSRTSPTIRLRRSQTISSSSPHSHLHAFSPHSHPEGPSSATLERTASLVARQHALAKLTGTAPPSPPAQTSQGRGGIRVFAPDEPLPTLQELQERARRKVERERERAGTGLGSGSGLGLGLGGGGREGGKSTGLMRNNTLAGQPSPGSLNPLSEGSGLEGLGGGLKRNNTVTGIGIGGAKAGAGAGQERGGGGGREAARLNLMRKLSARRLEGPSSSSATDPRAAGKLEVQGRLGRARPRSGSVGSGVPGYLPPSAAPEQEQEQEQEQYVGGELEQRGTLRLPLAPAIGFRAAGGVGYLGAVLGQPRGAVSGRGGERRGEEEEVLRDSRALRPEEAEEEEEERTPRPYQGPYHQESSRTTTLSAPRSSSSCQPHAPSHALEDGEISPRTSPAPSYPTHFPPSSFSSQPSTSPSTPSHSLSHSQPQPYSSFAPTPSLASPSTSSSSSSSPSPSHHLQRDPRLTRPLPTFGIAAVSPSSFDDFADNEDPYRIRDRGSSASSSIAGALLDRRRVEGSSAGFGGVGGLGGLGGLQGLGIAPAGENGNGNGRERGSVTSRLSLSETISTDQDEDEDGKEEGQGDGGLGERERKLADQVERKLEAAAKMRKEVEGQEGKGAFPPPEKGYQFPPSATTSTTSAPSLPPALTFSPSSTSTQTQIQTQSNMANVDANHNAQELFSHLAKASIAPPSPSAAALAAAAPSPSLTARRYLNLASSSSPSLNGTGKGKGRDFPFSLSYQPFAPPRPHPQPHSTQPTSTSTSTSTSAATSNASPPLLLSLPPALPNGVGLGLGGHADSGAVSPTSQVPNPMDSLAVLRGGVGAGMSPAGLGVGGKSPRVGVNGTGGGLGGVGMTKSASTESARSGTSSTYHSPDLGGGGTRAKSTAMTRGLSSSSSSSSSAASSSRWGLKEPRVPRLREGEMPGMRILKRLDEMLGGEEFGPGSSSPVPSLALSPPTSYPTSSPTPSSTSTAAPAAASSNPLHHPPRKLLHHAPILQVVNANTVKDRHLFIFTDLLIIAKPLVQDHPLTGEPVQPTLEENGFLVKSVVEFGVLKLAAVEEEGGEVGEKDKDKDKKRHPLLLAFVDRFANDPARAILSLIQKGGLSSDGLTIANLLFRNPDLNRNQLGAYLASPSHRHVLRAFVERFRFQGVRIDDAIRVFCMTVRLPNMKEEKESALGALAGVWTEGNGGMGWDPTTTAGLVGAILRLSDRLHFGGKMRAGMDEGGEAFFPEDLEGEDGIPTVDDFIANFRLHDIRMLVPEDLLTRIFTSVRRERIEQASDNSIFSMTPDIEASISPAKLPTRLTYRTPSEVFTITIPEPDPKFTIKLHGNDLQFDPPVLSFARNRTQSFKVTGTALGVRVMVLIKRGANAPRYQGLPLNKAFSVERGFMQHTFQVSFTNHLHLKRKYMFSTSSSSSRATLLSLLRSQIVLAHSNPPPHFVTPPSSTSNALSPDAVARAVSLQVLRDTLLPPDAPLAQVPSAAPSPRPNLAAPRFGPPVTSAVGRPRSAGAGRVGTPTRAAMGTSMGGNGQLIRSNSVSKLYSAQFRLEAELGGAMERAAAAQAQGRAGSLISLNLGYGRGAMAAAAVAAAGGGGKDDLVALAPLMPFVKKGVELVTVTEQNSLLPVVLGLLNGGLEAAPHPLSLQGSAFQLPPLQPTAQSNGRGSEHPAVKLASFISPFSTGTAL
ncbi:hypothetical protein JCM11641_005608 [Rhodosporidiobolus odoratus]